MKISILCFDLSSNAAVRAFLLAKLLEPLADVEVVGPQYGPALWDPVASEGIAWRAVPGRKFPRFAGSFSTLLRMADGDLVYACNGPDHIFSRDGRRDTIRCGRGWDVVIADKRDVVARYCEEVRRG